MLTFPSSYPRGVERLAKENIRGKGHVYTRVQHAGTPSNSGQRDQGIRLSPDVLITPQYVAYALAHEMIP